MKGLKSRLWSEQPQEKDINTLGFTYYESVLKQIID